MSRIALVGSACLFPDARTPAELWENVLAQRRAFRRIPPERLRLEDYLAPGAPGPDSIYSTEAALITDWTFDRVRFRVPAEAWRSVDPAHWLALDVAGRALEDAGFPSGDGLPRESVSVVVGNSLTGEFSRASLMRLRWPYVRRVLEERLGGAGLPPERRAAFLEELEQAYKAPFAAPGEEMLAGGLSNTIAGRICNHFDFQGGGYTMDGACSSSLLAVAQACAALEQGEVDAALAGGVDLSLDPFELVGFARLEAIARDEMRVYDARSEGFWPGEGSGFVLLMREEDARKRGLRIRALVRGWGISSDGSGGITRPEPRGQLLAYQRAYRRAGFGIDGVELFEGHGTGTPVGDAAELRTLSELRREAGAAGAAAIGSVKAILGHTKAAAGVAGLLKAAQAVEHQVLPPSAGFETAHPLLAEGAAGLRLLREPEPWPEGRPVRAGITGLGFGGINVHLVVEAAGERRRAPLGALERRAGASPQDAELFVLGAPDRAALGTQVDELLELAPRLSRAELTDLAARLAGSCERRDARGAVVAATAAGLVHGLGRLRRWLLEGVTGALDAEDGVFLGSGDRAPRIGLLFPGQGSPAHRDGGSWRRRFASARAVWERAALPGGGEDTATAVAQPAILAASLAAAEVWRALGGGADLALGHSLGEIAALQWGGALSAEAALRVAAARGAAMTERSSGEGAMATLGATRADVEELCRGGGAVIAGINGPRRVVVSGAAAEVAEVLARARARGVPGARLPVSHAFHSPLVAGAAPVLRACLEREELRPLERRVLSTVTGAELPRDEDLRALLVRQVTAPVLFADALAAAAAEVDLFVETGPGTVLTRLASEQAGVPVLPLDAGGPRLRPLLVAAGAAFALGAPIRPMALFEDRLTRPCPAGWRPRFLENPCEQAPAGPAPAAARAPAPRAGARVPEAVADPSGDPLALVRELVARRVELPVAAVGEGLRLLDDLHLNSIAVGELVAAAARLLGVAPPAAPQDYAHATVAEIATALREARESGARGTEAPAAPPGVDTWTRAFAVEEVERPLPHVPARTGSGRWTVLAPAGHALAEELRRQAGPPAVIVCLPPAPDERHLALLLDGARRAAALPDEPRLVLVQHGGGAASWARTFHQEHANATTVVLDLPEGDPRAAERVRAELEAAAGWVEARYDERGARLEPVLRLVPDDGARGPLPIGATDVLLVTGGGKGIAAESALALGRASGARVVLLGRSDPARDPGLAAAFERLTKLGLAHRYARADLTDADAVRAAVRAVEAEWGPVTAVLHGAGTNEPRLLEQLDEAAVRRTLAPKVGGLEHVLAAVDPARLRLLVAFGSVIARTGMRGEADYALANEWLTRAVERFAERHPACRALSVEWSVWSGVGMAERLGRVDALLAQGITPITADAGVALLLDLLRRPLARASVVATGRLGNPPTLRLETPELPVLRFLERVRVHVPGVELVAEARLSEAQDPYVADHVYRSSALFPAVLGLEAMAQAASALAGRRDPPVLDRVVLARPVTVPRGGARVVRLAALVRGPGAVEVTLRSEETGFQAEHFGAIARWVAAGPPPAPAAAAPPGPAERVALDPRRDLYGGLFFQGARFQRVVGYRLLRARECVAEVAVAPPAPWFGDYLPQTLLLGDPAVRDAALHSVQSSIPQAVVLPVAVGRIVRSGAPSGGTVLAQARERSGDGKSFVYDLRVTDPDGRELERWEGLELRAMERSALPGAWPPALLGPYVERRLDELVPGHGLSVVVERNGARSDAALGRALGGEGAVLRRPDGKPEAADGRAVSAAHGDGLTLAVSGRAPLSCDLEPVSARASGTWRDLLGAARFELSRLIADEAREAPDAAATRVWTAAECLKKAGLGVDTPLGLESREPDGWVLLRAGGVRVATLVASAGTIENRLAFAVLVPPRA